MVSRSTIIVTSMQELAYPKTLHHLVLVNTKLLGISDGELSDSESPTVKTGTKCNGTLVRVNLDVTEDLVEIGGDDDVDGLDGSGEGLVQILLGDLELEKSTINLVDDNDGLNTLTESLSEHSLGLDTHTLNGVNDDEGTVSDTQGSGNFRREINVAWGIDQVDQEISAISLLANNILDVLRILELTVQGDGSGLNGNATFLFIRSSICRSSVSSLCSGNNTSLGQERVGQRRLAVINVSNDGHVSDIGGLVHKLTDLINGEAAMRGVVVSGCIFEVSCTKGQK